jgi:hypothetical protein
VARQPPQACVALHAALRYTFPRVKFENAYIVACCIQAAQPASAPQKTKQMTV